MKTSDSELDTLITQILITYEYDFKLARKEVEQAINQYCNRKIVEVLEELESLPNVYPEKIKGEYTHVEAIYKSAITNKLKKLREE